MNNILIIDNYDSFTYNLVGILKEITHNQAKITVRYNDELNLEEADNFKKIIISPGPGLVKDAGCSLLIVKKFYQTKHLLGICLGHQVITEAFGGRLRNLPKVKHGEASRLKILEPNDPILRGVAQDVEIGHYHSWVADERSLPNEELSILAVNNEGLIMVIKHSFYDVYGLQFHPESLLTPQGHLFFQNWLAL